MKLMQPHYLSVSPLQGETFAQICRGLYGLLPRSELPEDDPSIIARMTSVETLMRDYYGDVLNLDLADRIAREFSGNYDTMKVGRPFSRWTAVEGAVWGLVRVIDVERVPQKGMRYWVEFRVAAGPATGLTFERMLTRAAIRRRLREIGIPKWKHEYPAEMFHDMFFTAWLGLHQDRIVMHEITPTASTEKHNKALVNGRMGECTGGYTPLGKKCTPLCTFGLDGCHLAWHRDTYRMKTARACRNFEEVGGRVVHHKGLMNKHSQGICIHCMNQGATLEKIRVKEHREGSCPWYPGQGNGEMGGGSPEGEGLPDNSSPSDEPSGSVSEEAVEE